MRLLYRPFTCQFATGYCSLEAGALGGTEEELYGDQCVNSTLLPRRRGRSNTVLFPATASISAGSLTHHLFHPSIYYRKASLSSLQVSFSFSTPSYGYLHASFIEDDCNRDRTRRKRCSQHQRHHQVSRLRRLPTILQVPLPRAQRRGEEVHLAQR
jgi:hypothetical protein